MKIKKIKVGKKYVEGLVSALGKKNLILIKGKKGYIMCGYLNLKVASGFNDVAIKITGVSNIKDAISAKVHSCTLDAKKKGIRKGQPIKEVLKIIS